MFAMPGSVPATSPRRQELLERAYEYVLEHGVGDLSLRPLAAAVSSSPRVLLFLFGSKAELVRALLARAREDELALLERRAGRRSRRRSGRGRHRAVGVVGAPEHRGLLTLWVEGYARSLIDPDGPWAGFAVDTVADWLDVLARWRRPRPQTPTRPSCWRSCGGAARPARLRDGQRTTDAVNRELALMTGGR